MDSFDIRSMLLSMRNYRMGLIQTPDQLRFSYLAIIEGGKRLLSDEDSTLSVLSSYLEEVRIHQNLLLILNITFHKSFIIPVFHCHKM